MDYKIIACDLDGTLLNSKMEVTEENLRAIKKLSEMGIHFVPCTGRTYEEIPENIRSIDGVRYFIHSSGAVVFDKATGERIEMCMSRERAKLVLDKVKEYDAFPSVRHNGRSFVNKKIHNDDYYREHRLSDNCRRFIFETNNAIDDFYDFVYTLDKVEMICTYFKYDSEKDECRKYFEGTGELSVAASEPYNIEMSDLSSGKGKALLALADKLGVDRKATIAVGDSKNDRNAIELAGLGLVMSNGTKELKEIADRVICSNEENVVEYLVREYFS